MLFFFQLWYVQGFWRAWEYYQKTLENLEAQIAVRATWRNIRKPLFQDYTLQGKIIGFAFRILRILLGLFIYAIVGIIIALLFLFWVLFPLLCVVSILGFFFGTSLHSPITTSAPASYTFVP